MTNHYSNHAPPPPLHLITYTDATGIGGAEISLGHLIASVSPSIKITVIGTSEKVVQEISRYRPNTACITLPNKGLSGWFAHFRMFQQLRPDILHFNCCTPWANLIGLTAGLTAAFFVPKTRIVRVDQLPLRTTDLFTFWCSRALCLRVDAHVAVGEASSRRMEDFYALGRDSVISIPNGVPDRGTPLPCHTPSHLDDIIVGSIGRLDAMKGHDILLRALAEVEGIQTVFLGEGGQRSALEQLAIDLGVHDRVTFLGWVPDAYPYLSQFDVVAMPSRSEGFPLAVVEAMLAARPVVATRVGSIPEAIISGETGILIEKENVADLANALQQLRDHPEHRLQLGQQARTAATSRWTAQIMAARYEQLWYNLMSHAPRPRFRVPRPKD